MLSALLGGALIGLAATLFLALNGRIAGVSTVFGDLFLRRGDGGLGWRAAFIGGIVLGYIALRATNPALGQVHLQTGPLGLAIAGLLVGYGTRMGGGCTSGHGVCGLARLSPRSLLATCVFMGVAMLTVAIVRHSGVFA